MQVAPVRLAHESQGGTVVVGLPVVVKLMSVVELIPVIGWSIVIVLLVPTLTCLQLHVLADRLCSPGEVREARGQVNMGNTTLQLLSFVFELRIPLEQSFGLM